MYTVIEGGVTAAAGFETASTAAGIKYKNRKDMAMIYSEKPCRAAGTFTTNIVKAAPVKWDQKIVKESEYAQAVVINAGIANACTGEEGMECCRKTAETAARELDVDAESVLVGSTGVIGMQIKKEPIQKGAKLLKDALADTKEAGLLAAKAIMTTDTVPKEAAASFEVDGVTVTVGGMSKGSGMIHPNMATMLSVTTTDAKISHDLLQEMVSEIVSDSFNMISVDRDTSTNDTYLVLANGESGVEIKAGTNGYVKFKEALSFVATDLAKQMAADGEGATRLMEVRAVHCKNKEEAKIFSKSVVTSNLVKAMVFGKDANWGRVLCALGYSGADFDPDVIDLILEAEDEQIVLVKDGVPTDYSEDEATILLGKDAVTFICDMKQGDASAIAWGCDLTYDYVKINGDYRS